jgi:hypothetical protein
VVVLQKAHFPASATVRSDERAPAAVALPDLSLDAGWDMA